MLLETPLSILKKYWGHDHFRALQEDIIHSVIQKKDTLALLPTGGGKSVCFQVPALLLDGICIVITPLIALMRDQVDQLKKKGILAYAIHSGMTRTQVDLILNNAIYGGVKFLYVSPERLKTEIFIERFKQMKVGLIAVDEAHCISQWGYDFRPPYLEIGALRDIKPDVPIIALTATATEVVQKDIMVSLRFKEENIFKKSFARNNLSFVVRKTESKEKKLLDILQKVKGSAIIYVRSRKATQDVANLLSRRGISATFYHAGLTFEQRTTRQDEWINNKTRVMVATNAFGMGIDKPDVRVVMHLDLPENLEAYYQEAGRAGRDGLRCYAAILYHDADILSLKSKVDQSLPSVEYLKTVYQAIANYYQLAVGSSEGESYDFDMYKFTERFGLNPVEVYNALKKLEEEGLLQFNESFYSPSTLHFIADHHELYQFQVANAKFDEPIKMLLRLYGGELFSGYVKISESYIASALKITAKQVVAFLQHLNDLKIAIYSPVRDKPQVTFITGRQDADRLPLNIQRLNERRKLITSKMEAMVNYTGSNHQCRMQMIQDYFNETSTSACEICDVCIQKRKTENASAYAALKALILKNLDGHEPMPLETLEGAIAPKDNELFVDVVRELADEGVIEYDNAWRLKLTNKKR
jgi:ATP-dependent DNA helicase RecQ